MITISGLEILAPETESGRTLSGTYEERLFTIRFTVQNSGAASQFVINNLRRFEYDEAATKLILWYSEPVPDADYDLPHTAFPNIVEVQPGASLEIEQKLPLIDEAVIYDGAGDVVTVRADLSTLTQVELRVRSHTSFFLPSGEEWATANALNQQIHDWGTEIVQTIPHTVPGPPIV